MKWRKRLGVVLALVGLAMVPHWRFVFLGEVPLPEGYMALLAPEMKAHLRPTPWNALWWDSVGQFWAWRTEAMRQSSEGRVPLWTNRVGCGFPFLANPQTQSLYPPAWFAQSVVSLVWQKEPLPLRSARAIAWLAIFHTLLALIGTYLLIRSFGFSRTVSVVGAAPYGLGSFAIAWTLLPTLPATAAWLPLTLWLLRSFLNAFAKGSKAMPFAIAFAFSLALLLLAGHGQIAIYALLAVLLFAGVELLMQRHLGVRKLATLTIAFFAAFSLAFLLAAAQLLPSMELAPFTHRHAPPTWDGYRAFAERGLTLLDWATLLFPFLFGNPMDGSYFGKESFADYCAYSGFGIFALALASAVSWVFRLKRKDVEVSETASFGFWHGVALFSLGALLASGSSFNLPFYFLLPGFAQLGTPTRAVFLCQLGLGLLAAFGLDHWQRRKVTSAADEQKSRRKKQPTVQIQCTVALVALFAAIGTIAMALLSAGIWLSNQLPAFRWDEWLATLVSQNTGIASGLFAILLLALSSFLAVSLQSPLWRFGVPVLLLAELLWFAAQQIPSARPTVIRQALEIAEQRLALALQASGREAFLTQRLADRLPLRLLLLGVDWSLGRYPQTVLPPNSVLLLSPSWSDVRNYDSLLLRHHKAVMALFSSGNPCPLENGNLILLPLKQVSEQEERKLAQLVGAQTVLRFGEQGRVAWHVNALRAFIPQKVHFIANFEEAFAQLPRLPADTALVAVPEKQHSPSRGDRAEVSLDKDALLRVEVRPVAADHLVRPVWIVLTDTAYPGWQAFQKLGDQTHQLVVSVVNGAFRGCHAEDASGEIFWVFFPSSFAIGAFLSLAGVAIAIGVLIGGRMTSHRGEDGSAQQSAPN